MEHFRTWNGGKGRKANSIKRKVWSQIAKQKKAKLGNIVDKAVQNKKITTTPVTPPNQSKKVPVRNRSLPPPGMGHPSPAPPPPPSVQDNSNTISVPNQSESKENWHK